MSMKLTGEDLALNMLDSPRCKKWDTRRRS